MTEETVTYRRVFFLPSDVFVMFPTLTFDIETIPVILGVHRIRNYDEWFNNFKIASHTFQERFKKIDSEFCPLLSGEHWTKFLQA